MAKTGRPKAEIDWSEVDKYLKAQCDGVGIAAILGIAADTLYNACERDNKMTFSAYSQTKKAEGKELLRQKQIEVAMDGDKTMLVWLGKQYLDQSDKVAASNINLNKTALSDMTDEELNAEIQRLDSIRNAGKETT